MSEFEALSPPPADPYRHRFRANAPGSSCTFQSHRFAIARARHLVAIAQIIDGMKDGIVVGHIHDGRDREITRFMLAMKTSQPSSPQKSSAMKKPPRSR